MALGAKVNRGNTEFSLGSEGVSAERNVVAKETKSRPGRLLFYGMRCFRAKDLVDSERGEVNRFQGVVRLLFSDAQG